MFKKSLLIGSCLVVVGMFGIANAAEAEEQAPEALSFSVTRALPLIKEAELKSGQFVEFNVGGFSSEQLASKFKVKFKLDTCEPETIVVDRFGYYDGHMRRFSSFVEYGTHGTIIFSVNDDFPGGTNHLGNERIRVMNASATTLKIKVGLTSGIHVKSQEVIDYSDIDFNL
ncbi:hypothetical protein [Enterococcus caccae]|uniref:DUF5626 domain-containing protein n=1 Tax=Enterococcus caccae ATCC BAA-1240 TaxID=1158612 RepID=R3WVH6_9ENTE|nr:hypothetical protein [Enterococcus caccae]EOL45805.1 hypothetical protein UC7_01602 [Enterococcus caccae ATCC BAA-1240]EOT61001.1 hypothetical protein I580_01903 [Enterococcus caccae ATCC BAA-1240]OJG27968.1 hypothetical protein RU98_GL002177 [Enterococcus caccae]